MSTDTGSKRSIDDIQDAKDTDTDKVPPQDADSGQGVVDIENNDTGIAATTTTAAATESSTPSNVVEKSNASKLNDRQRGQRMFGMLMGTLNQFDKAQKQNQEQARKRQAIDTKNQERLLEERKASLLQRKQERENGNKQRQIDLEERRMNRSILQRKNLAHYLTTATTPQLSYLPKILLQKQQEQVDRQVNDIESKITTTEPEQGINQDQHDKTQ